MRRSLAAAVAFSVLGLGALTPRVALADDPPALDPKAEAEALKRKGNDAMAQLDIATAYEAYKRALELTPGDAALYYNLGRVHQAREDFPAALDAYREFDKRGSKELKDRVPQLKEIIEEMRSRVVTLSVTCRIDDPKVVVTIAGKPILTGCSPTPRDVRVSIAKGGGPLVLTVNDERFLEENARASGRGGGPPVAVSFSLLPRATSGTLRVDTSPPGADVSVDDEPRGNPPLELALPQGQHTVVAKKDGYDDARVPVVIEPGATKDLRLELQKSAALTSRWWFWTGLGVLVIGAATTVTILVVRPERDPDAGTIPPGTIPAPLLKF